MPLRQLAAAMLGLAAVLGGCTVAATGTATMPVPTSPLAASSTPDATPAAPPGATLTAGGSSAAGTLGTWTLRGAGSDSPWLPATAVMGLAAGTGDRLAVRFDDGTAIGSWAAVVVPADDPTGLDATTLAARTATDPPVAIVDLPAPPPGRWVFQVRLDLADGTGQAFYSWGLTVR